MQVRNVKKLILILIFACLASLFSVTIVFAYETASVISPDISETLPDEGGGGAYYVFPGITTSDASNATSFLSDYIDDKYDTFYINNKEGFYEFCYLTFYIRFANKTIILNCDLDMEGESYSESSYDTLRNLIEFGGTFDGGCHTISNISRSSCEGGTAFCYYLISGGVIKNLIFTNTYTYIGMGCSGVSRAGVICNEIQSGATVENCIVNETKFKSNIFRSDCKTAAIAATNNGTIKNCLVGNIYMAGLTKNTLVNNDGMDCYVFSTEGSGTTTSCVFNGSITINNDVMPGDCYSDPDTLKAHEDMPTNCVKVKDTTTGLDWSNEGGPEGKGAWYYHKDYSSWPALRVFMYWYKVKFTANDNGEVSESEILIPSPTLYINGTKYNYETLGTESTSDTNDIEYTINTTTLDIYGQTITATPDDCYELKNCTIKANYSSLKITSYAYAYILNYWDMQFYFSPKKMNLSFTSASGVSSGDKAISPESTKLTYVVYEIAEVSYTTKNSTINGEKYVVLTYSFTDSDGVACSVVYKIYEKYALTNANTSLFDEGTIYPTVSVRTYKVTCKDEIDNATCEGYRSLVLTRYYFTVSYKGSVGVEFDANTQVLRFTYSGNEITYTPNTNCVLYGVKISKSTTSEILCNDNFVNNLTSQLRNITSITTITPIYKLSYEVAFVAVNNSTLYDSTNKSVSNISIKVIEGMTIEATLSGNRILAYKYNSNIVATYNADQFYIIKGRSVTVNSNTTITPTVSFYACKVTMGAISSSYGTCSVSGDSYGTENDGVFAVNFGTTVRFKTELSSSNIFTYTYTFSSGQTVKYTMKSAYYAMQYTISSGSRTKILNGISGDSSYTFGTGITSKTISPTFGKRQMIVGLNSAANTQTTSNTYLEVMYGDKITYTNSNNTNLTYTYDSNSVTYQPNAGFKCFNISYVGKTWSGSEVTLAETDLASVVYDITITPEYTRVYNVKFNTCENATLSASTNPIEIKYGESVTVDKTSTNKLVYKYNGNTVATYTAYQYYIWNTSPELLNVTGEQLEYTIQPTFEFNACMVTFGFIGTDDITTYGNLSALLTNGSGEIKNNGNGKVGEITVTGDNYGTANDGIFVVEFGTILTFTLDIDTYTYTFTLNGIETHKITYKITNDDYAMQYEINISTGERTKILNGLNGSDSYEFKKANGKSKTITPEFGQRQYMVEME